MAEINFTLEDFRTMVREEVKPLIEESELRITKAVAESFSEYERKYDKRLDRMDKRFDKIDSELKDIKTELKGHSRLLGLHSKEIMELKARAV